MEFDFNKSSVLKEAADAIRTHNYIHNGTERNAVLITIYLDFAADLIDKLANGNITTVRHGHWIPLDGWFNKSVVKCSVCGNTLDMDGVNAGRGDVNFCPNCGAKMDGDISNV